MHRLPDGDEIQFHPLVQTTVMKTGAGRYCKGSSKMIVSAKYRYQAGASRLPVATLECVEQIIRKRIEETGGDSHTAIDPDQTHFHGWFGYWTNFCYRHVAPADHDSFSLPNAIEIAGKMSFCVSKIHFEHSLNYPTKFNESPVR